MTVRRSTLSMTLSEFAQVMVTDFSVQEILDHLVERMVEVLPVSGAGVTLISDERGARYAAASDDEARAFELIQTELGEGPCTLAYETSEACLVPDLTHDPRFPRFGPAALESGLRAAFAFPLRHAGTWLGTLDLYRMAPGALSAEQTAEARTLAEVVGAYLVNAQARADLQSRSEQLQATAHLDPLTGLPNRALLMERLEQAFRRQQRSGRATELLFIDVDEFKAINDRYGHDSGDELLVEIARRLSRVVRPADTLARLAGDEFVILCEDIGDPHDPGSLIRRIEHQFGLPFTVADETLRIGVSIGVAFSGVMSDSPALILRNADREMYRRKRARRQPELRARDGDHAGSPQVDLRPALREAIARGDLRLAYQPIVTSDGGDLVGVEALLRWTHPDLGEVSPSAIIPFAERTGMIAEIGRWVLKAACAQRRDWQQLMAPEVTMSVNVSAHQFMAPGFARALAATLAFHDTPPDAMVLEVTETALVSDVPRANQVLADLRRLGVGLSLDDFGTGYSSLKYLLSFTVDHVKIDRDFVKDLVSSPASLKIVHAVIDLAHDLGVTIVAEGVETEAQLTILAGLGCDYCQGYYHAKPMPPTAMEALLHGSR